MTTEKRAIQHIAIVGGGTAGWMTAAALSHHFKQSSVSMSLVESSQLGTVGVGEATIPTLRRFYAKLGLTDLDVVAAADATCKLGIEFQDWRGKGSSFIHPFGLFGDKQQDIGFQHFWSKGRELGEEADISHYSLGVSLAKNNKFTPPNPKPKSRLEIFDWALHFDAVKFAALMKKVATQNGVTHIDGKISEVTLSADGSIDSLKFEDSITSVNADLYVDCSGFHGLLIDKALNTPYIDWTQWLLCDRAVSVQTQVDESPITRTIAKAKQAGWQWRIPLQTRQGNGYVYSSQFIDKAEATESLLNDVKGSPLHDPRHFSFTPGRREVAWNKNCVAVGLSAGFIEPLESTSIALIETAIDHLVQTFRQPAYSVADIQRFNEVTRDEYERVRDFIILHYKLNGRDDSELWRYCRDMSVPDTLQSKMDEYQREGKLTRYPWEIFGEDSWIAVYHGLEFYPQCYDKRLARVDEAMFVDQLKAMRTWIANVTEQAPPHEAFLRYAKQAQAAK